MIAHEQAMLAAGAQRIAGVDEVGRGCLAGPVVAAAVVFPPALLRDPAPLAAIADSKTLSAATRAELANLIMSTAIGVGVGLVPAHLIDHYGIGAATKIAMLQAIFALPQPPDALLIDWVRLPLPSLSQRAFAKADAHSVSVAAASIIAKVRRDTLMERLERHDPRYGWAAHKGYGTARHLAALRSHGPTPHHRRSFRPVSEFTAP